MAIRPIVRLGHPALRTPADPVPEERLSDPEFQQLIDDMFETMLDAGGVGLAAPQLGLSWQLFVYAEVTEPIPAGAPEPPAASSTPADAVAGDSAAAVDGSEPLLERKLKVLVNPGIEPESREVDYDWEGCLSIPDLRGLVPRYPAISVHALGRHGDRLDFRAEGYEARIIQHEFDHLNGMIFLDRMRDLRSLAMREEWLTYMTEDGDPAAAGVG